MPVEEISCVWEGSFFDVSSLALVNRKICSGLFERGINLSILPSGELTPQAGEERELKALKAAILPLPGTETDIHVAHRWPPDLSPPESGKWVIMQHWEFGSLPSAWIEPMSRQVDEIWVATNFVKDCFRRSGIPEDRVHVVPLGVNTQHHHPDAPPLALPTSKRFKFLFVGGTIPRKGIKTLLDCYVEEFSAEDDVALVIKDMGGGTFYRGHTAQGRIAQIQDTPGSPEIVYLNEPLNEEELAGLYTAADCLVHPYMGEGFGLPIAEAMASGLPVIVTGYGAALDFCNRQNSLLVPARKLKFSENKVGELETIGTPWLAQIDKKVMATTMRSIMENPAGSAQMAKLGRKTIAENFTWEQTVDRVVERMVDLAGKPIRRTRGEGVAGACTIALDGEMATRDEQPLDGDPPSFDGPRFRWGASVFNYSGYARLSRELLPAMANRGAHIQVDNYGSDQKFIAELNRSEAAVSFWNELLHNRVEDGTYFCFHPPIAWDGFDIYEQYVTRNPGFDTYVGITMFETDQLPPGWAEACNRMDEIWVPSQFNMESFARAGVDPKRLRLVQPGINVRRFATDMPPVEIPESGFTFLSVFQWTLRKGWDVLIAAYLEAFTRDDDVQLAIRTYPGYRKDPPLQQRIDDFIRSRGMDPEQAPRIHLVDEFVSEDRLPALYQAADAYVLPTRGEGWGLPFMEAMAVGLPTIGTRWSAHLDFMSDENSYLIDTEGTEPVHPDQTQDDPYYTADQRWAVPSIGHTAELLRHVFEHRDEAADKGRIAQEQLLATWTREKGAVRFLSALEATRQEAENRGFESSVEPPAARKPERARVMWSAPLYDPSGYAEEARGFLTGLDAAGVSVTALHRSWSRRRAALPEATSRMLRAQSAQELDRQFVHVQHTFPNNYQVNPKALACIGRTMYETDRLPDSWVRQCNLMDEIWVPSAFNVETFTRSGVHPSRIFKIPGSLPEAYLDTDVEPLDLPDRRDFAFLSVFDWTRRKGWDVLLRAFLEEFGSDEDVCLYLRVHSSLGYTAADIRAEMEQFVSTELGLAPGSLTPVVLLTETLSTEDMVRLYRSVDAYVMPSRGEGWGRPYMEAMAAALPVIGTGWSGNTEFMKKSNSYLIDHRLVDVPESVLAEVPLFAGHQWANPSSDHLRTLLREVSRRGKKTRQRAEKARKEIDLNYRAEKIARLISSRLDHHRARALKALPSGEKTLQTV